MEADVIAVVMVGVGAGDATGGNVKIESMLAPVNDEVTGDAAIEDVGRDANMVLIFFKSSS